MTQEKIDSFMVSYGKLLPNDKSLIIKQKLETIDDSRYSSIATLKMKSPTTATILSVFLGGLGVDRFYANNSGLGVGKLLTAGGCGLWWFIDIFLIGKAVKETNFNSLMTIL